MLRRSAVTLLLVLVGAAACGGQDFDPPTPFSYCAEQHLDGDVFICTRAYDDHPRIHLPADTTDDADGAARTVYAAFDPIDDRPLILRDGTRMVLADASGLVDPRLPDDLDRVPEGFAWQSYEFLDHVYELTGTVAHVDVDGVSVPAIADAVVRRIVRVTPEVLDGPLAGAWEGSLSRRIGENTYDPERRVAIRVDFTGFRPEHAIIPHWMPGDGELSYALIATGTIANATTAQTLADGSCAPSLDSLGDASPIAETTADVDMMRYPAMHVAGDYQVVWNGGMGSILPLHPGAAIQDAPRTEFLSTSSTPHGTPNGMHLRDFRAVAAGGATCTPPQ
jgi:hypothetical protein